MKWLESLETYLKTVMGVRKVPLAYLVRAEVDVRAHIDDLSTNYFSGTDEMIARASHTHPAYHQDNSKLWDILQVALESSRHYVSIRPYAARRNGRGAYLALIKHNLGSNRWLEILATAESAIDGNRC